MAINTSEQRRSATTVIPGLDVTVLPIAAKNARWRASAGWGYAGLYGAEEILITLDGKAAGALTLDGKAAGAITIDSSP